MEAPPITIVVVRLTKVISNHKIILRKSCQLSLLLLTLKVDLQIYKNFTEILTKKLIADS